MSLILAIVTDLIAVFVLAYGLYFRRHRRRDLLLAYTALNVGVLAVTLSLASVEVGIGLGIGLFGILSIIRLRSDQITQQEIAYYFVSLALGLLAGLHPTPAWIVPVLSALMVATMALIDSPLVAARTRRTTITLDRAYTVESDAVRALEQLLQAQVKRVEVLSIDTVRDTTLVDVRYRIARAAASRSDQSASASAAAPAALHQHGRTATSPGVDAYTHRPADRTRAIPRTSAATSQALR